MPSPSESIKVRSPSNAIVLPKRHDNRVIHGNHIERKQYRRKKMFAMGLIFALAMTFLYLFTQIIPLIPIMMPNDYFIVLLFTLGIVGILLMVFSKVRVHRRDPHKLQFKKEQNGECVSGYPCVHKKGGM